MLPARHRLRRSVDFGTTVRRGRRVSRSDLVIHVRRVDDDVEGRSATTATAGPKVGLIVAKSVGTAVQRHAVSRRLRHVVRDMLTELAPDEQLVIRALRGSAEASSAELAEQLRSGLARVRSGGGGR